MSLSWTYATLSAAVISHIDGDDSATDGGLGDTDNINVVIQSAEERILHDLPLVIFDGQGDITLTAASPLVTKPTGFHSWRSATIPNAGRDQALDLRSLEYLKDYAPDSTVTGVPKYIADYSETQWRVAPTPTLSYTGTSLFVKRPSSLVVTTTGTWISQHAGLLLLRACLVAAEQFIKGDERIAMWKQDYATELGQSLMEHRHLMRPDFQKLSAMPAPK